MAQTTTRIRIDLSPLKRFDSALRAGQRGAPGPINDLFTLMGEQYLAFAQRRFNAFSRGGGRWPPLQASTKAARRKAAKGGAAKRTFSILRDTGMLYNALGRGHPGNTFKRVRGGIVVGIGETDPHQGGKALTMARLAQFHNFGMGSNPEREIVPHELDERTRLVIRKGVEHAVARLGRQSEGGV